MAGRGIFKIDNATAPWGDYGDILISGLGGRHDDGRVHVERVGPWSPPITLCGSVPIVTDSFKLTVEAEPFSGAVFSHVALDKVVRIDWRSEWNLADDDPHVYPDSGEPEDYIRIAEHDPVAAEDLGTLWSLDAPQGAVTERSSRIVRDASEIWIREETLAGYDFFTAEGVRWQLCSELAKEWLENRAGGWLVFTEVRVG